MPPPLKKKLDLITDIREFVRFGGIASCQTKMLTGTRCGEPYNVTTHDVAVAIQRLTSSLAFIGTVPIRAVLIVACPATMHNKS